MLLLLVMLLLLLKVKAQLGLQTSKLLAEAVAVGMQTLVFMLELLHLLL